MHTISTYQAQAADIAIAFLRQEMNWRRRIDHDLDDGCLWAAIHGDGRIVIGNPVLRETQGFYVDCDGDIEFPEPPESWSLDDFEDLLPDQEKTQ